MLYPTGGGPMGSCLAAADHTLLRLLGTTPPDKLKDAAMDLCACSVLGQDGG
jgi:hypothetical protein